MNIDDVDWEKECSITNQKYQLLDEGIECYNAIKMQNRIMQLRTVAKLTTDNESIIKDYPLCVSGYGMDPYNEYAIKVADTYGTTLYILVHKRPSITCLLPILVGFQNNNTCSTVNMTSNWRMRYAEKSYITYESSRKEFGVPGIMMVLNTESGIYSYISIAQNSSDSLQEWRNTEKQSLQDKHTITAPSSAALILQIYLYAICTWKQRCLNRKVEHKIVHASGDSESVDDVTPYMSKAKQTIIDLKKNIIVYINDDNTEKRKFTGYCITESERCGHFRHLQNGKIVYIKPTTVHYKKLNPNKILYKKAKPVVYRNTEDFLREKSYLENDVLLALKAHGIKYEREKMFDWMGRKRLDFYLPDYNIAIECQGVQHFYPYGSRDNDFESRQKRDKDKYNECNSHGIVVVYYANEMIPIPQELKLQYLFFDSLENLMTHITQASRIKS